MSTEVKRCKNLIQLFLFQFIWGRVTGNLGLTVWGNHGGESEREIRLILDIDKNTKKPLYFRTVAGNIVEVSTLKATIAQLQKLGVKSTFSLLDGGYYSKENIDKFYDEKIAFLTRMNSGKILYKQLIRDTANTLEKVENVVRHNNRALFVECRQIDLFGHTGFAYILLRH